MTHPTPPQAQAAPVAPATQGHQPLQGLRVLSLALNLPGPAALMRLHAMGAMCTKVEPPAGDPMATYSPQAYQALHQGLARLTLDLKQVDGQKALHTELAHTDVLITSFRPSALAKLKLTWDSLHAAHPRLVVVSIVGAPGTRAEEPGHDLTYLAENDLVQGLALPATLYADMGGALATSEAVLQALMVRHATGQGQWREVALSDAAAWLALPRQWGLTQPDGDVGGAHAGYGVYPCRDGRVAVAALEPHFARSLCSAVGLGTPALPDMHAPDTRRALAAFFSQHTAQQLRQLASERDWPLHTLP
jgi:crotonobetainyl-CoA:carnitine CoA-transferase CaiB-like acyl-CoA transferase